MIKRILIAGFISYLSLPCFGTVKNIILNCYQTDFTIETQDGITSIDSDAHDIFFESDTLLPALPIVTINILIDENESYASHSASCTETLVQSNVLMAPNEMDLSDEDIYHEPSIPQYGNTIYPSTYVEYISTNLMDGAKFLTFEVHPFKYNAGTGKLYLLPNINLQINLQTTSTRANANSDYRPLNNMREAIKDIVVNANEVDQLYTPTATRSISTWGDPGYEYVIVTNEAMKNQYQRLADWKFQKGLKTKVVTVEEINNKYPNISNVSLRIKEELRDYYNGNYRGLKYVLLGGDFSILPSPLCYIRFFTNYVDTTPTDWFYSCFDTMDWDQNGNGVIGELSDHVDIYPEIMVTRLPSSNSTEAQILVDRIIEYESDPNLTNWSNRILMGGARLHRSWNGKSDAFHKGERIYSQYIQPYWNGTKKKFYDSGIDAPEVTDGIFSSTNLQNALQGGYPFVFFYTHGNEFQWRITDYYGYTYNDATDLVNPTYTFINASACKTNAFDQTTCLSKSFILNPDGNIMGYWGSSRLGFSKWLKGKIGQTNSYHAEFYKQLFTSTEKHYGGIVAMAKIKHLGKCHTHMRAYRWLLFAMNALGDPELPIYTQTPQQFTNIAITYMNGVCSVSTGGISGCKICAIGEIRPGVTLCGVDKNVLNTSFEIEAPSCQVCITKTGYIPYIATVINQTYVQNRTFVGASDSITSGEIYIGSDVTTSQSQGPVIVQSGSLTITSPQKVYIKNNFKVQGGAKLKIN